MSSKLNIKSKLNGHELDLSLMELKEVPITELLALPKATQLDLSCNYLTFVPLSFGSLSHLVKLDLSKNRLKELPGSFGQLKNLQSLDLYENQLKILPESFHELKALKWLDLKNNPLDTHLKTAAGECNTEEECLACAKQVVAFMQNVHDHLENEREKKRRREIDRVAAKKAKDEAEQERLRLERKAAKEKRKAEFHNQKTIQKKQSLKGNAKDSVYIPFAHSQTQGDIKSGVVLSSRRNSASRVMSYIWIIALSGLVVAGIAWAYVGNVSHDGVQGTMSFAVNIAGYINNGSAVGKQMTLRLLDSIHEKVARLSNYLRSTY